MTYEILIERRALRALAKIIQPQRDRITSAIRRLADEPRPLGVKKLSGREDGEIKDGEITPGVIIPLAISVGTMASSSS